jgi:hypothetical protein
LDGGGIFISYRREDTSGESGRLFDHLVDRYGATRVFRELSIERAPLRAVAENSLTGFFATHASRPPSRPEDFLSVLEEAW